MASTYKLQGGIAGVTSGGLAAFTVGTFVLSAPVTVPTVAIGAAVGGVAGFVGEWMWPSKSGDGAFVQGLLVGGSVGGGVTYAAGVTAVAAVATQKKTKKAKKKEKARNGSEDEEDKSIECENMSGESHDQGDNDTCYAYAAASALRAELTNRKIKNIPSHEELTKDILEKFETGKDDGGDVFDVLNWAGKKYGLRARRLSLSKAKAQVTHGHGVVGILQAMDKDFDKAMTRVEKKPKKAHTMKATEEGDSNHAVAIKSYNPVGKYFVIKNSWDTDWADDGKGRFKNESFVDFIGLCPRKCSLI